MPPDFYINGIVDVVAVFVFALLDATREVGNHGARFKGTQLRVGDDANDAGCVEAHFSSVG